MLLCVMVLKKKKKIKEGGKKVRMQFTVRVSDIIEALGLFARCLK
jgi:hypothetical protein